jgi:hypothetical protein
MNTTARSASARSKYKQSGRQQLIKHVQQMRKDAGLGKLITERMSTNQLNLAIKAMERKTAVNTTGKKRPGPARGKPDNRKGTSGARVSAPSDKESEEVTKNLRDLYHEMRKDRGLLPESTKHWTTRHFQIAIEQLKNTPIPVHVGRQPAAIQLYHDICKELGWKPLDVSGWTIGMLSEEVAEMREFEQRRKQHVPTPRSRPEKLASNKLDMTRDMFQSSKQDMKVDSLLITPGLYRVAANHDLKGGVEITRVEESVIAGRQPEENLKGGFKFGQLAYVPSINGPVQGYRAGHPDVERAIKDYGAYPTPDLAEKAAKYLKTFSAVLSACLEVDPDFSPRWDGGTDNYCVVYNSTMAMHRWVPSSNRVFDQTVPYVSSREKAEAVCRLLTARGIVP